MGRLKAPPKRLAMAPRAVGYADKAAAERARDQHRRDHAGTSLRGLYNTKRWRHPETGVRIKILERDGFTCQMPGCGVLLVGKRHAPNSPVVDHIKPHKGNLVLFWDEGNLQALCKRCHDGAKQAMDNRGGGSDF
jgi:5-methylcytosine-specific restriction endonuclease McrA